MNYPAHETLKILMGSMTFIMGWLTVGTGLLYIISRNLHKTSEGSLDVRRKAMLDISVGPSLESASQLMDAISRMLRTAVGVGAFLCLNGTVLCVVGYLMIEGVAAP